MTLEDRIEAALDRRLEGLKAELAQETAAKIRPLSDVLEKIAGDLEAMKAAETDPAAAQEASLKAIQGQMAQFAADKLRLKEAAMNRRLTQMQKRGMKA